MAEPRDVALLHWLGLTEEQIAAIHAANDDLVVTAGPGSGKTRTLVGRYLALLAGGTDLRAIAAITFTEKAANEMRSRIRSTVAEFANSLAESDEQSRWLDLAGKMESARISTIHGLCAEILRAHPVEAGLDPEFEVIDEAESLLLQRAAVEAVMIRSVDEPDISAVFEHTSTAGMQRLLEAMLANRLDFDPKARIESSVDGAIAIRLADALQEESWAEPVRAIRRLQGQADLDTQAMADMVDELLHRLDQADESMQSGRPIEACLSLFEARRQYLRGNVGRSGSAAKDAVAALRDAYGALFQPWLGGEKSQDQPPDPELEARYEAIAAAIWRLYQMSEARYQALLDTQAAVDFDGLEQGALDLLAERSVRQYWQSRLEYILVDEFQDTNLRQVAIVRALSGDRQGKLFVVGDANQSIYRFRGADVKSFTQLAGEMQSAGQGRALRETWRHHPGLLAVYDAIFSRVFGEQGPDAPASDGALHMLAARPEPPQVEAPYLAYVLGKGEDAASGRLVAAAGLADWLVQLRMRGDLGRWSDVALLFRASSGFSYYEDAFEAWGIPYVTVAGRGFFERPEIREFLNALRALAAPWDDRAMAGLLRASWIGLSDQALFQLRRTEAGHRRLLSALEDPTIQLGDSDELARQRARSFLAEFRPQAERIPVADLLKGIADWTSARAVLAIGGERMWSNLDKLIADARQSERVRVRAFLDYLGARRDAGVREGEAVADAQSAVRLMTVHRAKGLEFPIVVLADAGYSSRSRQDPVVSTPGGPAFQLDRWPGQSLAYRLAISDSASGDQAEEARLLYVALTRAKEKVVISGHLSARGERLIASGWLDKLLGATGIDVGSVMEPNAALAGATVEAELVPYEQAPEPKPWKKVDIAWPRGRGEPLTRPLEQARLGDPGDRDEDQLERMWRVTGRRRPPATVVGLMVHYALERWLLPPDPALNEYLQLRALGEGLVHPDQRAAAVEQAVALLARLRDHPLASEIEATADRRHEVPYAGLGADGRPDSGAFDLLLRDGDHWRLIDFKTDAIRSAADLEAAVLDHTPQLTRYLGVAQALLEAPISAEIVFLDSQGAVEIVPVAQV